MIRLKTVSLDAPKSLDYPMWLLQFVLGRMIYGAFLRHKGWETDGRQWRHAVLFGASEWMTLYETVEAQQRVKLQLQRLFLVGHTSPVKFVDTI